MYYPQNVIQVETIHVSNTENVEFEHVYPYINISVLLAVYVFDFDVTEVPSEWPVRDWPFL